MWDWKLVLWDKHMLLWNVEEVAVCPTSLLVGNWLRYYQINASFCSDICTMHWNCSVCCLFRSSSTTFKPLKTCMISSQKLRAVLLKPQFRPPQSAYPVCWCQYPPQHRQYLRLYNPYANSAVWWSQIHCYYHLLFFHSSLSPIQYRFSILS